MFATLQCDMSAPSQYGDKHKHYVHSGRERRGNPEAGYGILETRDNLLTRPGKAKNSCAILPWLVTMTGRLPPPASLTHQRWPHSSVCALLVASSSWLPDAS